MTAAGRFRSGTARAGAVRTTPMDLSVRAMTGPRLELLDQSAAIGEVREPDNHSVRMMTDSDHGAMVSV